TSATGTFTDSPGSAGTYWYGMHVLDNAGNWGSEPTVRQVVVADSTANPCSVILDNIAIKSTSCQQSEYSGSITIAHSSTPNNPVLKINSGTLNVDTSRKRITTTATASSSLYVYNVSGLGDVKLGWGFSFDVSGNDLKKNSTALHVPGGSELLAKIAGFEAGIDTITVTSDAAELAGKLILPLLVTNTLTTGGTPIEISFSPITLSQKNGFHINGIAISAKEIAIANSPVKFKDVGISFDDNSFNIEGKVEIAKLIPSIGGRITLMNGSLQGIAVSAGGLNIPIDTSPFFLNKIGGSVDGFKYPPIVITANASFSGGPEVLSGFKFACFNDVGLKINFDSSMNVNGGAGLLCSNVWDITRNGAITAQLEAEFNWRTSTFDATGDLHFPYDIIKSKAKFSISPTDVVGTAIGSFCWPESFWLDEWCFAETSQIINKKGIGFSNRLLGEDVAFFMDWGIAKARSVKEASNHIKKGTNLRELASQAKLVAKSMALAAPATVTVPAGLEFAIIKVTWETDTTDVTLTAPGGTVISPVYAAANPTSVEYKKFDTEAWYALRKPAAGNWLVDVANAEKIGTYNISLNTMNVPPTVSIISPLTKISSSTTVDISYTASDTDSTPTIALYYSASNTSASGTKIVDSLPMPIGIDDYIWNVGVVPAGIYYVFAIIEDGVNTPVISYAPGAVEITHSDAIAAPPTFITAANGLGFDVTWSPVDGATGYNIYYTDNPGVETYPQKITLPGAKSSYYISNLKPAKTYKTAMTAFNASGHESAFSTSNIVTTANAPIPALNVSVSSIDFGTVQLGQNGTKSMELTNTGNADLIISGADFLGTNSGILSFSGGILPLTIAANQKAVLSINMNATTSGVVNTLFRISSNDPFNVTKTIAVSGAAGTDTPPDGIINPSSGKASPDIGDALAALNHVAGIATLSSAQLIHADVAPLGFDGKPFGNGVVNIADVIILLRRLVGAGNW
ncbi:MAG: choice-of-anchor D domain-containing protein, partial [Geobacteraceae bacterium]